ncbi:MAG: hypothetical protein EOM34_08640 [Clostridia bacterium]|nr:hypothetical protein [Lachnospiraceae bacterium]NCC00733.1 hypothetical protein [Clostridia bacterium]NCD03097.1 hypothetical protein [Clostridia bacterium]
MDKPRDHNVLNTRTLKINYEFILDIDAERQNARDFIDFGNKQDRYNLLKAQERVLDHLFEQTKYAVIIEKTAEKLGTEFLADLASGKELDSAVKGLTSMILQPQVKERSR